MNTLFAMSTLILSGGQVLLGFAAVGVAIYLGIFATKTYMNQQGLKIKSNGDQDVSPLVRKYAEVDLHQHTKNIKLAGFAAAVAIVLISFAWTQFTSEQVLAEFLPELEDIEMEIPPTSQPKPKLPPALPPPAPKPSVIFEPTDEPEPEPVKVEEPMVISKTPSTYTGPTDPDAIDFPPVIAIEKVVEPAPTEDKIILIAEQMPRFPGCEDEGGNNDAKKSCADQRLLSFIYDNIKYPPIASEMDIEGMVVVSFVINKDGSVGDIKILREPGGGLGKETTRIIKLMNKMPKKWTPGKQRGKPVRVRYNLPVRFKLN